MFRETVVAATLAGVVFAHAVSVTVAANAASVIASPSSSPASPLVVAAGDVSGRTVTFSNTDQRNSTSALTAVLTGDGFVKAVDTCSGRALGPRKSCSITVTFPGARPASVRSASVTLAATAKGTVLSTAYFTVLASPSSRVSGRTWNDENGNGLVDGSDAGLGGWTIFVDYDDDGALDNDLDSTLGSDEEPYDVTSSGPPTDSRPLGSYLIANVRTGTWNVREVPRPNWSCTAPNVPDADPGVPPSACAYRLTMTGQEIAGIDFLDHGAAAVVAVVKDAQPDDSEDFHFTTTGTGPATWTTGFDLDDDGAGGSPLPSTRVFTIPATQAGRKSITETSVAGWTLDSLSCVGVPVTYSDEGRTATFDVMPGDAVTCTSASKKDATVTVTKSADPADGTDFDFSGDLGAFTLDSGGPSDVVNSSETFTVPGTQTGTKTITETETDGWATTAITCEGSASFTPNLSGGTVNVLVQPGDAVACTFVNETETTTPPASQLAGEPGAAATGAIPHLPFEFSEDDYAPHPGMGGVTVSFDVLYLVFERDTTVAQANALLAEIDAQIIGGRPGKAGESDGILFVRVPTTSHAEMDALIDRLNDDPLVLVAVQDSLFEPLEIPELAVEAYDWTWGVNPADHNWGIEAIRMPQLWNLNRSLDKGGQATVTGVLDGGFYDHVDLSYDNVAGASGPEVQHGTHVAGTIAASYDNELGVDGVNPYARLVVDVYSDKGGWGLYDFLERMPHLEVVNISLGHNWYLHPPRDASEELEARELVMGQAVIFELWQILLQGAGQQLPLIVAAAGNDSNTNAFARDVDARWSSPWNYAALVDGVQNVIVVEAVQLGPDGTMSRASFSNLNGHVSAPGVDICSTAPRTNHPDERPCGAGNEPYVLMDGTSMAAPHVSGLAGYLLSLDPTLTTVELRGLLQGTAVPVTGPASPRVDAFAAALAIDGLRGNSAVLSRLLDIDDGTADGNLRLDCSSTCSEFTDEDADGDRGSGDGAIDMSDFRRWRDWFLLATDHPDLALDGPSSHDKNDVNHDNFVGPANEENVYPDGDFNGDGVLDLTATRFVPGHVNAAATDLEVLQSLFVDPETSAAELPELVESADIHVDPSGCMAAPGAVGVQTKIFDATTGIWVDDRFDRVAPMSTIYTLPITPDGYTVRVEALDDGGTVVGIAQDSFGARLGSDSWFAPTCGRITLEPQRLNVVLDAGDTKTLDARLISEGMSAEWEFTRSVEHVEPALTGGTIAAGGEVALDPTVTCPETPGGYGGLLDLEFRDAGGRVIEAGVPESLVVDIVCLPGGVTAQPESVSLWLPAGDSASRTFRLSNAGTELSYEAVPGEAAPGSELLELEIEENASGVLPTKGAVFVTVNVTCPDVPGDYSRSVDLTFERADGKPVTVPVPDQIDFEVECRGAIRLTRQFHITHVHAIFEDKSEEYRSYDDQDTGEWVRWYARTRLESDPKVLERTPIPAIGFGDVASVTELTATEELAGGWADTRTVHGRSSLDHRSSYEDNVASFAADFEVDYSQSKPNFLWELFGDGVSAITQFEFELDKAAHVTASWSCGELFGTPNFYSGHVRLIYNGLDIWESTSVFESTTGQTSGCTFEGDLEPGHYHFRADISITLGAPGVPGHDARYEWDQPSAALRASWEMEISFPPDD